MHLKQCVEQVCATVHRRAEPDSSIPCCDAKPHASFSLAPAMSVIVTVLRRPDDGRGASPARGRDAGLPPGRVVVAHLPPEPHSLRSLSKSHDNAVLVDELLGCAPHAGLPSARVFAHARTHASVVFAVLGGIVLASGGDVRLQWLAAAVLHDAAKRNLVAQGGLIHASVHRAILITHLDLSGHGGMLCVESATCSMPFPFRDDALSRWAHSCWGVFRSACAAARALGPTCRSKHHRGAAPPLKQLRWCCPESQTPVT